MNEHRIVRVETDYKFSKQEFLQLLGLPEDKDLFSVFVSSYTGDIKVTLRDEEK